jgi:hypothetical protein
VQQILQPATAKLASTAQEEPQHQDNTPQVQVIIPLLELLLKLLALLAVLTLPKGKAVV